MVMSECGQSYFMHSNLPVNQARGERSMKVDQYVREKVSGRLGNKLKGQEVKKCTVFLK